MTDKLDFLDSEQTEPEVQEENGKAVEQEAATEPETPAEPEPEKGEEAAPPAAVEDEKPGTIPIGALLDERDRRKKAEREAEELRKWREQMEAQKQEAPDFFQDPDQRLAHERKQFEQRQQAEKLKQSRFFAEREFGSDLVNEAFAYFDQHPQLSHQFLDHPSPFHAAVEFYKRQKVADEIGSDPEAWKNKQMEELKEQIRAEIMAEVQTAQPEKPRLPTSLASAPSAGKAGEPQARGSAFDAAFGS